MQLEALSFEIRFTISKMFLVVGHLQPTLILVNTSITLASFHLNLPHMYFVK